MTKDYHLKVQSAGPLEGRDVFVCAADKQDAELQGAKQLGANQGHIKVSIEATAACQHEKGMVV